MTRQTGGDRTAADDGLDDVGAAALARVMATHHTLEADGPSECTFIAPRESAINGISLPSPQAPEVGLAEVLRARRSRYRYAPEPLSTQTVGALLGTAFAVTATVPAYGREAHPLLAAPSAGGLNPVGAYLVVARVRGLSVGVYRYEPVRHSLHEIAEADPSLLEVAYLQPEFARRAPASLLLTLDPVPAVTRYGPRHYRVLHIDVGIAAQSLYLVATALGLACCAVSGFREPTLRQMARLPDAEIPALLFPFGVHG